MTRHRTAILALAYGVLATPSFLETAPAPFDPSSYAAVDTLRLQGSPDPLPPLRIVKAFENLTFERPVAFAHAGDGSNRLFVCDQPGRVWVFRDSPAVEKADVFLDIRSRTKTKHFEEGLLGLAFHPKYTDNGEFFVYYSIPGLKEQPSSGPKTVSYSVVSRFKVSGDNPNRADPALEEEILRIGQPFGNHNGGSIEFGPDGMLYVGLGDGGKRDDPYGHGQNLETLLGSILRIDIDRQSDGKKYAIPSDNPYADRSAHPHARPEIFAYGIRNAWRLTFDRLSGTGWFADVGQDKWEEINILTNGANYGWKRREGRHDWKPEARITGEELVDPILEYPRDEGKSITGGYVYRGSELPELYGAYLYGDFVTFNLWALRYDGEKVTSNHLIARSNLPLTAYGESEAGEIYFAAFEGPDGEDTRKLDLGRVFNLRKGGIYRLQRNETAPIDTKSFPRKLSETGLFAKTYPLTPHAGLVPYDVNVPLWSDGAGKERYIALPPGGKIEFSETGPWTFPVGTVFVKSFDAPSGGARLETRLLVLSNRGWNGYTYMWNDEQTDAVLIDDAVERAVGAAHGHGQNWYFPSRSDCNACHTQTAGHVLGVNTRQLNRIAEYDGGLQANQLDVLEGIGAFAAPLPKQAHALEAYPAWGSDADLGSLAKAYLDVNCSNCHAPGGTGLSKADLRFHTDLANANLLGQEPGQGRLGPEGTALVTPGSPLRSELVLRMMQVGSGRMPTLASTKVDWEAVRVLGAWIETLAEN